jgi:hypothetical protein
MIQYTNVPIETTQHMVNFVNDNRTLCGHQIYKVSGFQWKNIRDAKARATCSNCVRVSAQDLANATALHENRWSSVRMSA